MQTVIITGASAGIGLAVAETLGRHGYRVYGFSRRQASSAHFTSLPVDITVADEVQRAVAQVLAEAGRIDVLINNAGRGMVGAVEDAATAEIRTLMDLNLIAPVEMMRAVLPVMRQQGKGKIINVSSIGSEMGLPFRGFYSASKSALDKITEAMRYEVSQWNIDVCVLHLGDIRTGIADSRVKSAVSPPYQSIFDKVYGLMNAHVDDGTPPEDVANYVEGLLNKPSWKAHYYFGKFGQKIGVPLKWLLPQSLYENLMRKYNGL